MDDRLEAAAQAWQQAILQADRSRLDAAEQGLDALQADLDLARGRLLHARFIADRRIDPHEQKLFQAAAERYRSLGDVQGEAQSTFMLGIWHQVVLGEVAAAVPYFDHALDAAPPNCAGSWASGPVSP